MECCDFLETEKTREEEMYIKIYQFYDDNEIHALNSFTSNGYVDLDGKALHQVNISFMKELIEDGISCNDFLDADEKFRPYIDEILENIKIILENTIVYDNPIVKGSFDETDNDYYHTLTKYNFSAILGEFVINDKKYDISVYGDYFIDLDGEEFFWIDFNPNIYGVWLESSFSPEDACIIQAVSEALSELESVLYPRLEEGHEKSSDLRNYIETIVRERYSIKIDEMEAQKEDDR